MSLTFSKRQIFRLFSLVLLAFYAKVGLAETLLTPAPFAKHYSSLDNINLAEVNTTFQDSKGVLWLATEEGVIRFDGFSAEHFLHNPANPNSLGHNRIYDIVEGPKGNLWLSSFGGGLIKFDPKTKHFSNIDLRLTPDTPEPTKELYDLMLDQSGVLWIGSIKRPMRYDTLDQKPLPLPEPLQAIADQPSPHILISSKGDIWVSTMKTGLYRYDGKQLHHYSETSPEGQRVGSNVIRYMYEDLQNNLWFGTHIGLTKFDQQTEKTTTYLPSQQPPLSAIDNDIFSIVQDNKGKLWLGGVLNGVFTFDPQNEQFEPVSGANDLFGQFKATRINHIFKDKIGSLWFAGKNGLTHMPQNSQRFKYISNEKGDLKITELQQYSDNELLFAANWSLYHLNLQDNKATQRLGDKPRIYRMENDSQGNWYVASLGGGLMLYDLQKNLLSPLPGTIEPPEIAPIEGIYDVIVDQNDTPWIIPLGSPPVFQGGLLRYHKDEQLLKWQATEPYFLDMAIIDQDHILLASGLKGLYSFFPADGRLAQWQLDAKQRFNRVQALFKDSRGHIWIADEGKGLYVVTKEQENIHHYTTADGLQSNYIISINEDKQGNLWLGSKVGLTRLNVDTGDTLNIEHQDGLLFADIYKRTLVQLNDGRLATGTNSGIVLFDPNDFEQQQPMPAVRINDFLLFNKSVAISTEQQPTVLKQAIEYTEQITLTSDDYLFSFDFSATEFQRPDKVLFAYRMKGLDEQWVYTDSSNRRATYATQLAKDYVFEVKVSNSEGQWSEEVASIKVTVLPPWYLSTQAIIAYIFLTLASIYAYIRIHTANLKAQAKELEAKVSQRTEQLRQNRDELAKKSQTVSELLAQKQRLFASVSHEFRTPLTLILSPVEQLLKQRHEKELIEPLSLVKRNSRRLLRMVDQLLEFAKLEQQSTTTFEAVEAAPAIELICASFNSLVSSKAIELQVEPPPEVTLYLLPDSLNKILINILSNAFKYTPGGGSINVSFKQQNNALYIAVKDTGIGIAEQDRQAIFERFNRATQGHTEAIAGAGIGLSLVKELAEANRGEITLDSQLGKGSTFTVKLPLASKAEAAGITTQPQDNSSMFDLELDSVQPKDEAPTLAIQDENTDPRKTILVIDDNADMRNLLQTQLGEQYYCYTAANGEQGLNVAREQLPDMVISDIMMPVMDGYELAEHLRADMLTCHIPIILLTAKGSVESRIKGLKLLVDDYLPKPFNLEELQLRIHNIISIRDIIAKRCNQALEQNHDTEQLKQAGLSNVDQKFVNRLNEQLQSHYQDIEFGARRLSEELSLSERQLHRKIRALFDVSIPEMVRNFRLKKAQELLFEGQRASQVYFNVGFASHSYFSSCFKAKYGKTPKEFQKAQE